MCTRILPSPRKCPLCQKKTLAHKKSIQLYCGVYVTTRSQGMSIKWVMAQRALFNETLPRRKVKLSREKLPFDGKLRKNFKLNFIKLWNADGKLIKIAFDFVVQKHLNEPSSKPLFIFQRRKTFPRRKICDKSIFS